VQTDVKNTQEAIAAGAMALFGEKYGDKVRVVSIPGFSVELCGGTHVAATGDIGAFYIISESGVAAGVRRIEAVTGMGAWQLGRERIDALEELSRDLNSSPRDLARAIAGQMTAAQKLRKENQELKTRLAMGGGANGFDEAIDVAGVKLIAREVSGLDKAGLRELVDRHRDRIKSGVVVLASPAEGKVSVVVGVTPDLIKRVSAGQVVKQLAPIVGGGGGGRPDFAEAGGKDPSKIAEMLAASRGVIEQLMEVR
jgi:alanyl-tRNA synthetase